jgi:hypothetical protein
VKSRSYFAPKFAKKPPKLDNEIVRSWVTRVQNGKEVLKSYFART